jgi:hypothetical protein
MLSPLETARQSKTSCCLPMAEAAPYLIGLARVASLALAVGLLYIAAFLTEDEESGLQNKLEIWWIRIDDQRATSLSRRAAFLQAVALLASRGFDRVFGSRLFSLQAFAISCSFSIASLFAYLLMKQVIVLFDNPGWVPDVLWPVRPINPQPIVFPVYAGLSATFVGLALLPGKIHQRRLRQALYVGATLVSVTFAAPVTGVVAMEPYYTGSRIDWLDPSSWSDQFGSAEVIAYAIGVFAIVLSFGADLLFIVFTRVVLRSAHTAQISRIVQLILSNMAIAVALLLIPQAIGDYIWSHHDIFGDAVQYFAYILKIFAATNVLDALLASTFVGVCLLLLAHYLCWPVIQRPVYAMQKLGIVKRRALLATAALALFVFATGRTPELLEKVAEALTE